MIVFRDAVPSSPLGLSALPDTEDMFSATVFRTSQISSQSRRRTDIDEEEGNAAGGTRLRLLLLLIGHLQKQHGGCFEEGEQKEQEVEQHQLDKAVPKS